ncbi:hypothetical protein SLA2020_282920 [Shorea laevis]
MQMYLVVEESYYHMAIQEVRKRIPQRTSPFKGPMYIHWVLSNPNPNTCYERFRMMPSTFLKLCNTLKQNGLLQSSRYVKITEQVAIFCLVASQRFTQRSVADRMNRSTETIHKYCRRVCHALCKLGQFIIKPVAMQIPHPYVEKNFGFYYHGSW